jgi:hypothetical protein
MDNVEILNVYKRILDKAKYESKEGVSAYLCIITKKCASNRSHKICELILDEIKEKILDHSTWCSYMWDENLIDKNLSRTDIIELANIDRIKWLNKQIEKYQKLVLDK